MRYSLRATFYLFHYAGLMAAPLIFLFQAAYENKPLIAMFIAGIIFILVPIAVYAKVKRHHLFNKDTWRGRRMMLGEALIILFYFIIAILMAPVLMDNAGELVLFIALLSPFLFLIIPTAVVVLIIGVRLVPIELNKELANAT